jgi:hypothetical protein
VPPPRCPACGRFLSRSVVQGLRGTSALCPRCGTQLSEEAGEAPTGEMRPSETHARTDAPDVRAVAAGTPGTEVVDLGPQGMHAARTDGAEERRDAGPAEVEGTSASRQAGEPVRPWVEDEQAEERTQQGRAASSSGTTSVRPPDLPPTAVRPEVDRDVLEGWDTPRGDARSGALLDALSPERSRAVAVVLGAGVAGGLIGAAVSGRRRTWGAIVGTLVGAVAALVGTRVLDPDWDG